MLGMVRDIRTDPERWREGSRAKGADPDVIDRVLELDDYRRELQEEIDLLRRMQNVLNRWIGIVAVAEKRGSEVTQQQRDKAADEWLAANDTLLAFYERLEPK